MHAAVANTTIITNVAIALSAQSMKSTIANPPHSSLR